MTELCTNIGVRSFVDVKVIRAGVVTHDLKDCGNDLLDGWFALWVTANQASQGAFAGCLKLGSGGSPTDLSATALEVPVPLVGAVTVTHGVYGGTQVETYDLVNEAGTDYVIYSSTRLFNYSLGQWVGTLREVGANYEGVGGNIATSTRVQTRILLPQALEITAEDQLIITHKVKVKVLNQVSTQVVTAMFNGVPVDVTITQTPGPISTAPRVLSNCYYQNTSTIFLSNIGVGDVNANFPITTMTSTSIDRVISGDAVAGTRSHALTITAEKCNTAENEISALAYGDYRAASKWSFNPPIPKTPNHVVKLTFVVKVDRL